MGEHAATRITLAKMRECIEPARQCLAGLENQLSGDPEGEVMGDVCRVIGLKADDTNPGFVTFTIVVDAAKCVAQMTTHHTTPDGKTHSSIVVV